MKVEQRQIALKSLDLSEDDIYLAMGYRGYVPESNICALVMEVYAEILPLCTPRCMFQILDAEQVSKQRIQVGAVEFTPGGIIGSYLPGLAQVCMFVATAGEEYDTYLHQLKKEDNVLKEYVADSIGTVIAEACVTWLGKKLEAENEVFHTLPYSPGYCGWDIREQQKLFSLFPDKPCGITLSDTCLMSPVKSVSGFIGLGKELHPQPYRCEICTNKYCYKRKEKKI